MCGNANGGTVEMLGNTTTPYHFLKLHILCAQINSTLRSFSKSRRLWTFLIKPDRLALVSSRLLHLRFGIWILVTMSPLSKSSALELSLGWN